MRKNIYKVIALLISVLFLAGCGKADEGREPAIEEGLQVETESTTEVEKETEPEPVVTTVTITATGDCSLGALQMHGYSGSFHSYYDSNGEGYFFQNFKEVFEADDLTLINLECVLSNAENRVEKTYNIKGKPEYTGIMTSSSVEAVSLGNNHSADYGPESLVDTKNALDAAGILYAINYTSCYYTTDD